MANSTSLSPLSTQDERIIAALSHVAILLPLIGIIAPIIIWVTQKERSRFVAFQALQAIAFQLLLIVIYFGGILCYMGSFFLTFLGMMAADSMGPAGPGMGMFLPFVVFFGTFLVLGIFVIYGIVAAVLTFQGKDFRYALVGRWVERYTQPAPAQGGNPVS